MGKHLIGILKRRSVLLAALGVLSCALLCFASAQSGMAQTVGHWHRIRDTIAYAEFFLNRDYGFAGQQTTGSFHPALLLGRTTDGGKTWEPARAYDPFLQANGGRVKSLFMHDSLTGWLTFSQYNVGNQTNEYLKNGIHATMDGGMTWTDIKDSAQWNSVYWVSAPHHLAVSGGGLAFEDSLRGMASSAANPTNVNFPFSRTVDGGRNWIPLSIEGLAIDVWSIYCDRGSKTYLFYNDNTAGIIGYVSSDFGTTWKSFQLGNIDCLQSPNSSTGGITGAGKAIYIQSPFCGMYRSTDDGSHWISIGGPSGLTDTRIFAPEVCQGAVAIASGASVDLNVREGLWMTTDGGDGSIPLPGDTLTVRPDAFTGTISSCDTSVAGIFLANCGCTPADYHFDSAVVVGDSRFSIANPTLFPKQWNGFASRDSLLVRFAPNGQSGAASAAVHIYGRIVRDTVTTSFDSVVHFQATASAVGPHLTTVLKANTNTFDLGGVSICTGHDSTLSIKNTGCGPATIDSESLAASGFDVTQLTLPLVLPKDSTITLHVHATLTDTIQKSGTVTLHITSDSVSQDLVIQLQASGVWGTSHPVVSPFTAQFPSVSYCVTDSLILSVLNTGCDSLVIDSASIDSDPSFFVRQLPGAIAGGDSSGIVLYFHPSNIGSHAGGITVHGHDAHGKQIKRDIFVPISGTGGPGVGVLNVFSTSLQAGSFSFCAGDTTVSTSISNSGCDTLRITNIRFVSDTTLALLSSSSDTLLIPNATKPFAFTFAPRTKGPHTGTLSFHSQNIHGTDLGHDTTISIAGLGTPGHKYISQSLASADLGAIHACESRDTVFSLKNTGCDTLRIDSASFTNLAYSSDVHYPIVLAPDSSVPVRVHFDPDTTGHPLAIAANYIAHSDADTASTVTVPLQTSIIYPIKLALSLVAASPDSGTAGTAASFALVLTGDAPVGVSAIHFDLTHDDNLLSYVSLSGAGLSLDNTSLSGGLATQSFTLSPVTTLGTVGTLAFGVYLSPHATTPVTLSNLRFDAAQPLPADCIASITDTSAAFHYVYACGQGLMQQLMVSGMVKAEQNYPNPVGAATGFKTTIPFETSQTGTASIRIVDQTGHEVLKDNMDATYAGKHFFYFTGDKLPTGTYYYMIEFPKGVVIVCKTMLIVK